MKKYLGIVKQIFKNHPIVSNSIIYGSLCVGAEFSQQTITNKFLTTPPQQFDVSSIARFAIYGTAIGGPLLAVWYRWLDKKFVGNSFKIIIKKVLIDQFFMTPQLLVIFYIAMSVMEQKSNLLEECMQKFIPTYKNSCLFWLPVQTLNFLLISPAFRVTYVGGCSFVWVNILCWIKRQEY